jgi:hypothetical protein
VVDAAVKRSIGTNCMRKMYDGGEKRAVGQLMGGGLAGWPVDCERFQLFRSDPPGSGWTG